MASLTFDSATFWNDSTTGIGVLRVGETLPRRVYDIRQLPLDDGQIAVDLGENPGTVALFAQYRLSSGDFSTLMTAITNKVGSYGDLSWSSDIEGRTVSGCIMHPAPQVSRNQAVLVGGNIRRLVDINFNFIVLQGRTS